MSAKNVELIRQGYVHLSETGELDVSVIDPEIEWHVASDLPDSGVHRGIEALRRLTESWADAFDYTRPDIQEILDRGDYIVVSLIWRGRIKGSDEEVAMPETHVFKMRADKAIEVREYRTLSEALDTLSVTAGD